MASYNETAAEVSEYEATIDSGEGGTTTIHATDLAEAMGAAVTWAEGGWWPVDGSVIVRVTGPDGHDERVVAVTANVVAKNW